MPKLVECVPNFSEARRPEVVQQIADAMRAVSGVKILDIQSDTSHNRTVITSVGAPDAIAEAAFQGCATAARLISLDEHQGEHPRIGATDVIPFIPLHDTKMEDCIALAKQVGARIGSELQIPVYLYEQAATRPERQNLADVRKGEYEGLKSAIATPARAPDFGPAQLGTAGATAVGARGFLIAYNVYLNTSDVNVAKAIAKAIRHSSGGMRHIKALGLLVDGVAQVSMNMTDYTQTPLHRAVELIRIEAKRYGCLVTRSELVGLLPQQALIDAAVWYLQLDGFNPQQVLENQLAQAE